jgi:ATP-dependent helicase/nuclease subunit B
LSAANPRVFTVASGVSFLPTLVDACIAGTLGIDFPTGGRDFSAATIYVPTRRAARALSHAFAHRLQPRAVLLPRIVPLGDPFEIEEQSILHQSHAGTDLDKAQLLPAIGDLDRRLLLAELIRGWQKSRLFQSLAETKDGFSIGESFASSYALSGDLARLIDEFAVEGANWHQIGGLVTETFDTYWSLTRSFLDIAGAQWPAILKELGFLDPSTRLNMLLETEAMRLRQTQPHPPVIAAGSTGTVPATARLLAAIARLPNGAVILPGLDRTMDSMAWDMIGASTAMGASGSSDSHPQSALKRLLGSLGIERESVIELGEPAPELAMRTTVLAHAARSVEATEDWPALRNAMGDALSVGLQRVSVFEASDERREALGIAIALRGILEQADKTAALITPDRALAQRVSAELRRWGIQADDSAGVPLGQTVLGSLARLICHASLKAFDVTTTAAILNSGIVPSGMQARAFAQDKQTLELVALRGQEIAHGLDGIARSLDAAEATLAGHHAPAPLTRITAEQLASARTLLAAFVEAMHPFNQLAGSAHGLKTWARAHQQALTLWAGERAVTGADAVALGSVFDTIINASLDPQITLADYDAFLDETMRNVPVAPATPVQGRIKIWGLLEARLLSADRVILGGLSEGIWPPDARNDAFLNRSMRAQLGLSSPDRRIGQSAHDFVQALGAPDVILARALTVEGKPMVSSRFLRRLDAFAGTDIASAMRKNAQWLETCLDQIDAVDKQAPMARPAPCPGAALQPETLSITEISTLYRDPYAIYAKHILKLSPLDPLVGSVDARDRGEIIHAVLAKFVEQTQSSWPDDPWATIVALGEAEFAPYRHLESVNAFWWPMFENTARWFVGWQAARRSEVSATATETGGALTFSMADGTAFRLRGRADRIDVMPDGTLAVIDYKTGSVPSAPQIHAGIEPQLALQAALARAGQFKNAPAGPIREIGYAKVGREPGYAPVSFEKAKAPLEDLIPKAVADLKTTLDRLRAGTQPFLSHRMLQYVGDTGDYDHLARTKEWIADDNGSVG